MRAHAIPVLLLASAVLIPAPVASQPAAFGADTGLMILRVRADRTAVFEAVVAELVAALQRPAAGSFPLAVGNLKVLRPRGGTDATEAAYVVLVEGPVAGVDYSLEHLVRTILPDRAAELVRDLEFATDRVPANAMDLTLVQQYSPTAALLSRLEGALAGQLLPVAPDDPAARSPDLDTQQTLDRLRHQRWTVEGLAVTVAEQGVASWRYQWSYSLRNLSLDRELIADVSVDFLDEAGTVLDTARAFAVVGVQGTLEMSGEIRIATSAALRVESVDVRVEPR